MWYSPPQPRRRDRKLVGSTRDLGRQRWTDGSRNDVLPGRYESDALGAVATCDW
jgi:hypothetical protein